MKLNEVFNNGNLEYEGFVLAQEEEHEFDGDNVKIWHSIRVPGEQKSRNLDHSPYERITMDGLKMYVEFFKVMGHFPTREDIPSNGPVNNKDLPSLVEKAVGMKP